MPYTNANLITHLATLDTAIDNVRTPLAAQLATTDGPAHLNHTYQELTAMKNRVADMRVRYSDPSGPRAFSVG